MNWLQKHRKIKSVNEAQKFLEKAFLNPDLYLSDSDQRLEIPPATVLSDFFSKNLGETTKKNIAIATARLLEMWVKKPPADKEAREELIFFGSSEKFMGDFRFRERAKCMI